MPERIPFPEDRVCGEKFRGFLNLAGGVTKDKPCSAILPVSVFCNEGDCETWKTQAEFLWTIVLSKWRDLNDTGHSPSIAHMRPDFGAYMGMHNEEPDCTGLMTFGFEGASEAIQYFISEIELGICILDRLEHEMTVNIPSPQGAFVLPSPPAASSAAAIIMVGALGALGALGVGLYAYGKKR